MTAPSLATGLSPAGRNARSARPPLQGLSGADGHRATPTLSQHRKDNMTKPIKTNQPAPATGPSFADASRPLGEVHVPSGTATLADVAKREDS
jgi:hypothetical protein